ncbi:MAG: glycosyltransferase family A protein [Rikenellaceae bacterium]
MKPNPTVSICIPLYNAERYIAQTLHHLRHQRYRQIEVVIVDDHSTDRSLQIAREFESEQVRIFENPRKGGNAARNYAFEQSRGDYIKFLDADDYCSSNLIGAQMARLLRDGTPRTLIFSPVRMLYRETVLLAPPRTIDRDYTPAIELIYSILEGGGWNCTHSYLVPRALVVESGGWDETIIKNQDGEFFARVAAIADSALSVAEEYAVWRQTGVGVSTKRSTAAHASVLRSYATIARLLLDYRDTPTTRRLCGERLGYYLYENYPFDESIMRSLHRQLEWLGEPLTLPPRRALRSLTALFGWRMALRIMRLLNI